MSPHGKGILKLAVLIALGNKELTAYEIKKEIKNGTFNVYEPSSGVLYPILRSLVSEGIVEVYQKENRKYYRVTEKGKSFIIERMDRFKEVIESQKEKYKTYGKIGMELGMLRKIIFTMDEAKVSESNEKILKILREAEDKIKELW
jgi:PadR family transcriptional regulator PadR